jgi:hypothetical protein
MAPQDDGDDPQAQAGEKLWFLNGSSDAGGDGASFAQQLTNGAFIGRPTIAGDDDATNAPRLWNIGLADLGPLPDLNPCFGRGTGWTDAQWASFDTAQKIEAHKQAVAADRLEAAATALDHGQVGKAETATMRRFEDKVGLGNATPQTMRQAASMYRANVGALEAGSNQGYVADAYSAADWAKIPSGTGFLSPNALGAMVRGSKTMLVNRDHPWFGDPAMVQWMTGHEPFHGVDNLSDELVRDPKTGVEYKAYKFDRQGRDFDRLRQTDPLRAARNPDHLVDFAN